MDNDPDVITSTISTSRLSTVLNKEVYSANLSGIGCYIEPAGMDISVLYGEENAGKVYKCIIQKVADIKITDKITDKNSNVYIVQGIEKYENNLDVQNQTEITMIRKYPE